MTWRPSNEVEELARLTFQEQDQLLTDELKRAEVIARSSGATGAELVEHASRALSAYAEAMASEISWLICRHETVSDESKRWAEDQVFPRLDSLKGSLADWILRRMQRSGMSTYDPLIERKLGQATEAIKSRARLQMEKRFREVALAARQRSAGRDDVARDDPDDKDEMVPELFRKSAFERDLLPMAKEAARDNECLACVMFDGDRFKSVNDEHGHDVGDEVIKGFGSIIARLARKRGRAYRVGGDEFALLLPNHTCEEAAALAERIRKEVEQQRFAAKGLMLTMTFGVAALPECAADGESLFRAADQTLISSKKQGKRNTVQVAARVASATPQDTHGDLVARKAAEQMRAVASTQQREAVLDERACSLLDLCLDAFVARVRRWQEDGILAQNSEASKKNGSGAVFALEDDAAYRAARQGVCAFSYDLRSVLGARAYGWIQVEVPVVSIGDPVMLVRWHSTMPGEPSISTVLLQRAEPLAVEQASADVQSHVDRQVAAMFGRIMDQLARHDSAASGGARV